MESVILGMIVDPGYPAGGAERWRVGAEREDPEGLAPPGTREEGGAQAPPSSNWLVSPGRRGRTDVGQLMVKVLVVGSTATESISVVVWVPGLKTICAMSLENDPVVAVPVSTPRHARSV